MKSIDELPERIRKKIHVNGESGCWEWTGYIKPTGYGVVSFKRRMTASHRVVYTLLVGEIGHGLHCDHLCRNRSCCNPAHIEIVTPIENWRRSNDPSSVWARSSNCPKCGGLLIFRYAQRTCVPCRNKKKSERNRERYKTDREYREQAKARSREWCRTKRKRHKEPTDAE